MAWVKVNPTVGGRGENTVSVSVSKNDTAAARKAIVLFKAGNKTYKVNIKQDGMA